MISPEVDPITSLDNPLVKRARALHAPAGRRRYGAFLVEGLRSVEAAAARVRPQVVWYSAAFGRSDSRGQQLLRDLALRGVPVRPVSDRVLDHIADTVTPQGIVAVLPLPHRDPAKPWPGLVPDRPSASAPLILVLDQINDPGNAGTLLRSAAAAGVGSVVAVRGAVDLYAPKVVRAAAGAHFHLQLHTGVEWRALQAAMQHELPRLTRVLLAESTGERAYWDIDWTISSVLIVGNEARGASPAARALSTDTVAIPMRQLESLNVGVAGSVILFEALRQRSARVPPVPFGGLPGGEDGSPDR